MDTYTGIQYLTALFERTKGICICLLFIIGYCILGCFFDKTEQKPKRHSSNYIDWGSMRNNKHGKKSNYFNKRK